MRALWQLPFRGGLMASEGRPIKVVAPVVPRVWALASGKGGVGKSLLAANLACLLAEGEWPTTVVDLDFDGANLHTFLGVSAEGPGLRGWLHRQGEISTQVESHEMPGLSYLRGATLVATPHPGVRERRRLLGELGRLPARTVILDLGSGVSPGVLDFFLAADLPLLVVLPEPASIENAHQFLKQVYLRRMMTRAGARRPWVAEVLAELGPGWRPVEVVTRLAHRDPAWAERLGEQVSAFSPGLILNQIIYPTDVRVGFDLVGAVRAWFGFRLRFMGAVGHDPQVGYTTRRRRLFLREETGEVLAQGLSKVAEYGIEGGELEPGDPPELDG